LYQDIYIITTLNKKEFLKKMKKQTRREECENVLI